MLTLLLEQVEAVRLRHAEEEESSRWPSQLVRSPVFAATASPAGAPFPPAVSTQRERESIVAARICCVHMPPP